MAIYKHFIKTQERQYDFSPKGCSQSDIAGMVAEYALIKQVAEEGGELDIHMRQMMGVAKAKGVAGAARLFLEADIPLLMFGWHRDVYRIWRGACGVNAEFICGVCGTFNCWNIVSENRGH